MILITTDLHFSDNPRDAYRHDFMPWFTQQAKKLKATHSLILGDLTEQKDNHGAALVNDVVGHIYNLAQICPVTILRGNHDYINPDSPFFGFLNQMENVSWINKPTLCQIDDFDCLFLPHTRNYKRDWKSLLQTNYDWIFAHNTFEGTISESGKRLGGIPQNIFRKSACIISGDIHTPQELELVIYIGSPYRINFGDSFDPRIMLIHSSGCEYIPCPGPYKQLLEVRTLAELKQRKDLRKGDMLKIKVELTPTQYDKWQETKDLIREWCEQQGFIVESIRPTVELQNRTRVRKQEFKSDEDAIRAYVKRRAASEQTLETGLKLKEEG